MVRNYAVPANAGGGGSSRFEADPEREEDTSSIVIVSEDASEAGSLLSVE